MPLRLASRVLHERDHTAGHESRSAHGFASARHLRDLNDAPPCSDLDAASRGRGADLIGPRAVIRSDDNLDAVVFHDTSGSAACGRN
jgi:hypothetical protein